MSGKLSPNIAAADEHDDIMYPSALPFILLHLSSFAAFWSGITWQAVAICVNAVLAAHVRDHGGISSLFLAPGLCDQPAVSIRAGVPGPKHHPKERAVVGRQTSSPSSAFRHRQDVHSPRHKGFFYSHVGWIFYRQHDLTDLVKIGGFCVVSGIEMAAPVRTSPGRDPGGLCFLIAGWSGLVVGFVWSTVLLYHATFCINSLAHVHGRKRYVTGDDSRNNWLLAFFTMGEGWHNNHHAYQSSARQGFRWWEIDVTYYILKALSFSGSSGT